MNIPPRGIFILLSVKWYVPEGSPSVTAVQPQHSIAHLQRNGTDMQISSRTELPLTAMSSSGCACCSTEARVAPPTSTDVEVGVEGLTCGGCVGRLERAVKDVHGVDAAAIELVAGGVSRLLITGSPELAAVHDAVRYAGYALTR